MSTKEDKSIKQAAIEKVEADLSSHYRGPRAVAILYQRMVEMANPPLPDQYKKLPYSRELAEQYLEHIRAGLYPNRIFELFPGMPHPASVRRWRKRNKWFDQQMDEAWRDSAEALRQIKLETHFEEPEIVEVKPGVFARDPAAQTAKNHLDKALEWEIKARNPERYSRAAIDKAVPTKRVIIETPDSGEVA